MDYSYFCPGEQIMLKCHPYKLIFCLFLQDKDTKVGTCGYCGLQFQQKHHHWDIFSVFASLYKSPYWLINYVCLSLWTCVLINNGQFPALTKNFGLFWDLDLYPMRITGTWFRSCKYIFTKLNVHMRHILERCVLMFCDFKFWQLLSCQICNLQLFKSTGTTCIAFNSISSMKCTFWGIQSTVFIKLNLDMQYPFGTTEVSNVLQVCV